MRKGLLVFLFWLLFQWNLVPLVGVAGRLKVGVNDNQWLAFVDADDLDWLYEALARYGITLHDQLVHSSLEVKDSDPPPNYPTA